MPQSQGPVATASMSSTWTDNFAPNKSSSQHLEGKKSLSTVDKNFPTATFTDYPEENTNPADETERWEFERPWLRLRQRFLFKWVLGQVQTHPMQDWRISKIWRHNEITRAQDPDLLDGVSPMSVTRWSTFHKAKMMGKSSYWSNVVGKIVESADVVRLQAAGRYEYTNADGSCVSDEPKSGMKTHQKSVNGTTLGIHNNKDTRDKRGIKDVKDPEIESPHKRSKYRREIPSKDFETPTKGVQSKEHFQQSSLDGNNSAQSPQKSTSTTPDDGYSSLSDFEDPDVLSPRDSSTSVTSDVGDSAENEEPKLEWNMPLTPRRGNRTSNAQMTTPTKSATKKAQMSTPTKSATKKAQMTTPTKSATKKSVKIFEPHITPPRSKEKHKYKTFVDAVFPMQKLTRNPRAWRSSFALDADILSPDGKSKVFEGEYLKEDHFAEDHKDLLPGEDYPEQQPFYDALRIPHPDLTKTNLLFRHVKRAVERRIEQTVSP